MAQAAGSFREDGAIGSSFKADGTAGGTAQSVGGPLDKKGAIGHQFTTEGERPVLWYLRTFIDSFVTGAIGGTVQAAAERISGGKATFATNDDE